MLMITGFAHRGLREFFETGSRRGIRPEHATRLRLILGRLHAATHPRDMALPGLRLHALKGRYAGFFAVDVSGNWRVVFRFVGQEARDVDYLDYH
jgi:proteic killer suppression protein